MPLMRCQANRKPGWKWGESGKCYTYTSGDSSSEERAKTRAREQGAAIEANKAAGCDKKPKKPYDKMFEVIEG